MSVLVKEHKKEVTSENSLNDHGYLLATFYRGLLQYFQTEKYDFASFHDSVAQN